MTISPRVEHYLLTTRTGRPIRKATRVIFPDGGIIAFTERLGKRDAILQALMLRKQPQKEQPCGNS